MEIAGNWLAWPAHRAAWAIGIPWIIGDEIRLRRKAPKPADVAAYADRMETIHGRKASSIVEQAMYDARTNGDFQTRRFLKEVSGELMRRLIAHRE